MAALRYASRTEISCTPPQHGHLTRNLDFQDARRARASASTREGARSFVFGQMKVSNGSAKAISCVGVTNMAETAINIIDALRGQQEQLKRLLAQPVWISDAPKATLSEMEAQVSEIKRLLTELEKLIQDQLERGQ